MYYGEIVVWVIEKGKFDLEIVIWVPGILMNMSCYISYLVSGRKWLMRGESCYSTNGT